MRIYSSNNRAVFHPDANCNDGAISFFEEVAPQKSRRTNKKNKNKMSIEY